MVWIFLMQCFICALNVGFAVNNGSPISWGAAAGCGLLAIQSGIMLAVKTLHGDVR